MNFFSHAVFAAQRSDDPSYIVGSMAPDFAGMAGLRLRGVEGDAGLERGVAFHHRSDDAFHGAPIFVELMEDARIELEDRGLGFGPAAAVGHVGVELILDGCLVDRLGGVPSSYREAMGGAADLADRLVFHAPRGRAPGGQSPGTGDAEHGRDRWRYLCTRLALARFPQGYCEPQFVADRLVQILARRPRLAVAPGDEPELLAWVQRARATVAERSTALLEQVHARLAALEATSTEAESPS